MELDDIEVGWAPLEDDDMEPLAELDMDMELDIDELSWATAPLAAKAARRATGTRVNFILLLIVERRVTTTGTTMKEVESERGGGGEGEGKESCTRRQEMERGLIVRRTRNWAAARKRAKEGDLSSRKRRAEGNQGQRATISERQSTVERERGGSGRDTGCFEPGTRNLLQETHRAASSRQSKQAGGQAL